MPNANHADKSVWNTNAGDHRPIYIRWLISLWCNYNCHYCFQRTRNRKISYIKHYQLLRYPSLLKRFVTNFGHTHSHAFDNYRPQQWVESFSALSPRGVSITITGGEPFLDRKNFYILLKNLCEMEHIKCIRIDTNGFWSPEKYAGINWDKIELNISFHPTMISADKFIENIKEKKGAGINVGMVNFVLHHKQIEDFFVIKNALERIDVFTNVNVYTGPDKQTDEMLEIYSQLLPEIDFQLKSHTKNSKGHLCAYPVYAYSLDPMGIISVGCFPQKSGHFVKNNLPERFLKQTPCPNSFCNCLDMYSFSSLTNRAINYDILANYVRSCINHRKSSLDTVANEEISDRY
ncbi:MAG: 4Fe-4S cluster-binding domain-containing protein [Proteobacteria bacterium]|nr:4Fe-4S cluster-binding domain-containing protein [Pseudomonadota bacterium]MBU2467850.1 4Fe-4S cluster-binding domain-containing protein [Pseudomonadota bacterium]MBU2519415.1 4Fe-4S cluster-binding domain-containing protein [Pseudomonadota bacterium]